jgi:hypothetical protein
MLASAAILTYDCKTQKWLDQPRSTFSPGIFTHVAKKKKKKRKKRKNKGALPRPVLPVPTSCNTSVKEPLTY